jgi:hypothetical protein
MVAVCGGLYLCRKLGGSACRCFGGDGSSFSKGSCGLLFVLCHWNEFGCPGPYGAMRCILPLSILHGIDVIKGKKEMPRVESHQKAILDH